jgi:hypothetical protein
MDANRLVFLGGLTYLVYGGLSLLSVGSFLPPVPFKPVLFLIVTLGAMVLDKNSSKQLRVLFGAFILLYSLSNVFFWEMFFGHEFLHVNVVDQLDIFLLFGILLLFGFNFMFIASSVDNKRQRLVLNIFHATALPIFVLRPSLETLDIFLIGLAVFHVIIVYWNAIDKAVSISPVYAHLLSLNALLICLDMLVS